ncbi:50S ribosomal protein L21 [uncultured Anaerococcus sp.]|uniref:50S ribosomal protein L21 n=1 Tax=uncultured Anaerococcus sp. TaxID=293428 RepID=UPI00288AAFC1|nr:50S ribosomal protein L21 [uncultured Anaerococcus sp.]
MYAIIKTGGKQYKVSEGDLVRVEKLAYEVGETVDFDQVLLVSDNGELKVGSPLLEGAKVSATVEDQNKDKKIVVYKYKPKKQYRKKHGHRQPYTLVKINSISL